MTRLIILTGLLAASNAYTYAECQRVPPRSYTPPQIAAEAQGYRELMQIAEAMTPKEMK